MRNYLLPAVVCAAIGALVLLLAKRGEKVLPPQGPTTARTNVSVAEPPRESPLKPAETRTPLDEHKAMRELQRALAGNLTHALDYRQLVCEDMTTIVASEKLSKDLLDTIKEYIDSEDKNRRDVVIPILRVFENAEATRLIADRYYRAPDEEEQMTLLEAMSKPFHDPKQATVWGLDKVMTSPSAENRERAYDILKTYINDDELLIATSMQVYAVTTDDRQRQIALREVVARGDRSATARAFGRRILRHPRDIEDVLTVMGNIMIWAEDDDAAQIERLADEFPAAGEPLRIQAREIRRHIAQQADQSSPGHEDMERRHQEDVERAEAARKKREAEAGGAGGNPPPPEGD